MDTGVALLIAYSADFMGEPPVVESSTVAVREGGARFETPQVIDAPWLRVRNALTAFPCGGGAAESDEPITTPAISSSGGMLVLSY
jgi:hypothetical protein